MLSGGTFFKSEFPKAIYTKMSISGFYKINTQIKKMLNSQLTITRCTLGRIFPFQKEAVSQMSVTNSNFAKTLSSRLMIRESPGQRPNCGWIACSLLFAVSSHWDCHLRFKRELICFLNASCVPRYWSMVAEFQHTWSNTRTWYAWDWDQAYCRS